MFYYPGLDKARRFQITVDGLGQLDVVRGVGPMPVIKLYMKTMQVFGAFGSDAFNQLDGGDTFAFCFQLDGRPMRIIGPDTMHCVATHALGADPDVRLYVLHDVANMKRPVSVG